MDVFDLDEAQALCSMFDVKLVIMGNYLFRLDYHYDSRRRIRNEYDWAYLKSLDREQWYGAVAHLRRHDLQSPACNTWTLQRCAVLRE